MLDIDTIAKLTTLQEQLQAEQATLAASLSYVQNIKDTIAASGMSLDELLAMKETVFAQLPEAEELQKQHEKVTVALSAIAKILPASA